MIVNTHKPPAACGVGREPDFLDRTKAGSRRPVRQKYKFVRLSNYLSRPIGGLRARQIKD
jgi:hypothetical protein